MLQAVYACSRKNLEAGTNVQTLNEHMERASDDLRTRDSLSELIYHGLLEERIFGGGTLQQPEGPIVVTMTDKGLSLLGEAE